MIRKTILLSFFLFLGSNVGSQEISPFIGYSNSFVSGRDVNVEDLAFFNSGVSAGVLFVTGRKKVRFLSAVYFQQKGYQTEFNPVYKHKSTLNYFEINVGASYHPFDFLSFNAGGYFSGAISGFMYYQINPEDPLCLSWVDPSVVGLKALDFGAKVGASFLFINNFSLQLNYSFGLSSIGIDSEIFNHCFQTCICYSLNLKNKK